ncbi:MAG: FapA family protein [Candidatus Latescibacteria bacterium]|nr:hypothetical protein [Gemmatimonadaceae bacterium]MDP7449910.1 FapA family protein [Candidatus Latescibacterota bacterium]HJP29069.1 FapA family protein [Candidatus Latescibacterota bacterium]
MTDEKTHSGSRGPTAPMAATTVLAEALTLAMTVDELVGGEHAADLVVPGQSLGTPDAERGWQTAGDGIEEGGGSEWRVGQLGYLHIVDGCVQVISPVWVAEDGSEAHLLCLRALYPRPQLRPDWVQQAVQEAGVCHGVVESAIEALCRDPATTDDTVASASVLVACATPPVHGSDGRIDYSVDLDKRAGLLLPDGSIDLRERNSAVGVTAGQTVVRIERSTPGQNGSDVRGKALKAENGADPELTSGENVRLEASADAGEALVAEIDGNLAVESGVVHVRSVFTVPGDVDYDVGNIDVPGDVEIRGLVGSGFSVKAGGTIAVTGTTEPGATLQARGDVIVGQGIVGEKTRVIAGGSVTTKFIQNSSVAAAADVTVGSYIFSGRVRAGAGAVRVENRGGGRGGSIVGGQVLAGTTVEVHRIGSPETDRTLVGIAIDPTLAARVTELRQDHQKLITATVRMQSAMRITSPNDREQLAHLLARTSAADLDKVEAQLQELRHMLQETEQVQAKIDVIEADTRRLLSGGRVHALQEVFADVQIQIGPAVRQMTEKITGACEFYSADGRVQWRAASSDRESTTQHQ